MINTRNRSPDMVKNLVVLIAANELICFKNKFRARNSGCYRAKHGNLDVSMEIKYRRRNLDATESQRNTLCTFV